MFDFKVAFRFDPSEPTADSVFSHAFAEYAKAFGLMARGRRDRRGRFELLVSRTPHCDTTQSDYKAVSQWVFAQTNAASVAATFGFGLWR